MNTTNLKIVSAVAGVFDLTVSEILSRSRREPVAFARQIAIRIVWGNSRQWGQRGADKDAGREFKRSWYSIRDARRKVDFLKANGSEGDRAKIRACEEAVGMLALTTAAK